MPTYWLLGRNSGSGGSITGNDAEASVTNTNATAAISAAGGSGAAPSTNNVGATKPCDAAAAEAGGASTANPGAAVPPPTAVKVESIEE